MKEEHTMHSSLCPRCTITFSCGRENIESCFCSQIKIDDQVRERLAKKYGSCLCPDCLRIESGLPQSINIVKKGFLGFVLLVIGISLNAQSFAPAAGMPGTTAMDKDSSVFVGWAKTCSVNRGYMDISNQGLGKASAGDNSMGTGEALANGAVSLGDAGEAICTFEWPIKNGPGNDFAVFENSFDGAFLELAFVEVSSDGVNFFRFPAQSLTDSTVQTGSFANTDPTKIHNLAGKYVAGFGTPFDLQELSGKAGLNINAITHVKIVDVIGTINKSYCSRDAFGRIVNDPWPTDFAPGGFDLDAVGVVHFSEPTAIANHAVDSQLKIFPNPAQQGSTLHVNQKFSHFTLTNQLGQILLEGEEEKFQTADLQVGIYFLKLENNGLKSSAKLVIY